LKKTVLFILVSILLLLLIGRFGGWHPVTPPHVAARWKEISFTRIKPAAQQVEQKDSAKVSSIKILKPGHPAPMDPPSNASQP
jgi:hypothetical protein